MTLEKRLTVALVAALVGLLTVGVAPAIAAEPTPHPPAGINAPSKGTIPAPSVAAPRHLGPADIASPQLPPRLRRSSQPSSIAGPGRHVTAAAPSQSAVTTHILAGPYQLLSESLSNHVTPPDTQVAAGPGYLMEVVNVRAAIYTILGAPIGADLSLQSFLPLEAGFSFSDPRVAYDQSSGRWYLTTLEFTAGAGFASRVYLAISKTSNPDPRLPNNSWSFVKVFPVTPADQLIADTQLCDQPQMGWSNDKITISCNNFLPPNNPTSVLTRVLDKVDLLAGGSTVYQDLGPSLSDVAHSSLSPARSYTDTETQFAVYNRGTTPANAAGVVSITGRPDSVAGISVREDDLAIATTPTPPGADQLGTTMKLDTGDNRFQGASWRDGLLWTGGDDACTPSGDSVARACLRLVEVGTVAMSVMQDFDVGLVGAHAFYPGISTDTYDNMFVTFTASSSSMYPSIEYTSQLAAAPSGTVDAVNVIAAGLISYSDPFGNRWGDYSAAVPDPVQPGAMWLAAEYTPSAGSAFWGTGAAEVAAFRCSFGALSADKTSPQPMNTPVTFTAAAGGCGGYTAEYQFYVYGYGTWTLVRPFSTSPQWSLDYTKLGGYGTYTIDVWIRNQGSKNAYDTFGLMAWVVGGCNLASTANTSGAIYTTTAGGVACLDPEFKVWIAGKGKPWTIAHDWYSTNTFDMSTVSGLAAGTYSVDVWVRQHGASSDTNYYETWGLAIYIKGSAPCSSSAPTLGANPASPQSTGVATVTLTATGCGANAQYEYWLYPGSGGGWQLLRGYGASGVFSWNTPALPAGNYSVDVWAKPPGSATADYDSYALYSYEVNGCTAASVSADTANPQSVSTPTTITFTATAAGCANAEYSFWVLPEGGRWQNVQAYGSTNTWSRSTSGVGGFTANNYAVAVWVRQKGGPTGSSNFESYAAMSYTITQ